MNKRLLSGFVGLLLVLAVAGCSYGRASRAPAYDMEAEEGVVAREVIAEVEAPAAEPFDTGDEGRYAPSDIPVEPLIVRNAYLDLVVRDTEAALDEINNVVDDLGGYVVQLSVSQYGGAKRGSVQLRVPAEKLDEALDAFRGLATEVQSEDVSAQDVTDEYVDLQSRLRSKEATEAKLLEFLEEAEDTEAALSVYAQLERIQTDIEVFKGRMQYLEQSAAMSSVSISLTPDELAQPIELGGWNLGAAWRDAVEGLDAVFRFLVEDLLIRFGIPAAAVLLVIALPIVGLIFLIRFIVRRRKARKAPQTAD
jgi:hypothetical protein